MKHGSYTVFKTFEDFAIGYNGYGIQPFVTWDSNEVDVDNAVFHSNYEEAFKDVETRRKILKKSLGDWKEAIGALDEEK